MRESWMSRLILSNNLRPKLQVFKLINRSQVEDFKSIRVRRIISILNSIYYQMTDMENLDNTESEKKSWYAAMREKHAQEMADLQAKLDAEIAGRAADKKLYFGNIMKSRGYEWDFDSFADKYGSLSIDDMASLYMWQNWKAVVNAQPVTQTETTSDSIWPKSVIAWANPTTEVGTKSLDEMTPEEIIAFAKTQSWYKK